MSDDLRDLARAGLAPLVEDVPDGPGWQELISTPVAPGRRSAPGWLIGVAAAVVVFGLVGVSLLLPPNDPAPPVDNPATTAPFDDVIEPFDAEGAAADAERWWDLVIGGDFEGAAQATHTDSQFDFPGLADFVGRGSAVDVEIFGAAFGNETQPQLCFVITGGVDPRSGSMVYRVSDGEWTLWEVRPNVERCLDGDVEFPVDITSFDIVQPIPITVLASDANGLLYSWVDLEEGTIATSAAREQIGGYSSAIVDGEPRVYSWAHDGSVYDNGTLVLETAEPAHSMRVLALTVRDGIWVTYVGGPNTVADLYTLSDDQQIVSANVPDNAFPAAVSESGLILNTVQFVDTGDGLITDPGSERVVSLSPAGESTDFGPGQAIAATPSLLARFVCPSDQLLCDLYRENELVISSLGGDDDLRSIEKPREGTWMRVGGPMIPSDSMPLPTVSPDGTRLLVRLGQNLDVNGVPATSQLMVVDLETGETTVLAEYGQEAHEATWSRDGGWVLTFDYLEEHRIDVTVVEVAEPGNTFTYEDLIPDGQFPLAAG
jgi:hypothetical protein